MGNTATTKEMKSPSANVESEDAQVSLDKAKCCSTIVL
jgi:hypothetical protein